MIRKTFIPLIILYFLSFTVKGGNSERILIPELKTENRDYVSDAEENSMVRMQNKFLAGIETSLNPSFTADDDFMFRTLANFRIGYRLQQHVLTGGLGVEFTDEMFIPITIDYKYYFNYTQKWSPFAYGQVGYSWHLKGNINSRYNTSNYKQIDPGALASVGFGYSVTTNLNEFYFAVGYSYRDYVEVTVVSSSGAEQHLDKTNNGLAFTLGFNF
ncbi:hypothetical protein [Maribellus mangrovi]|uniref:hypothetical protein n=1 Tax=Maribellus mangrovi TaxID=3133146 RepID=UPI0030ED5100